MARMLPPEIIEKIRREREERRERQRPAAQIPLWQPEIRHPEEPIDHEEKTDRVIVIDLA